MGIVIRALLSLRQRCSKLHRDNVKIPLIGQLRKMNTGNVNTNFSPLTPQSLCDGV